MNGFSSFLADIGGEELSLLLEPPHDWGLILTASVLLSLDTTMNTLVYNILSQLAIQSMNDECSVSNWKLKD